VWRSVDLRASRVHELAVTAGSAIPTGSYNAKDGAGNLVEPHGQLGTGGWGPFAGLSYRFEQMTSAGEWDAFANVSYRPRTEATYFDAPKYKFGDALLWSVRATSGRFDVQRRGGPVTVTIAASLFFLALLALLARIRPRIAFPACSAMGACSSSVARICIETPRRWSQVKWPLEERGTVRGCLSGTLVSLLVAGQLAGAAHLLIVHHEVCPFDGELVHSASGGERYAATRRPVVGFPAVSPGESVESHHGHEHCLLASHRRQATIRAARLPFYTPPSTVQTSCAPERAPRPNSIALHLTAPKQSPPA
jgi:hypothetical protein